MVRIAPMRRTRTASARPRLVKVDAEMRRWCERLEVELSGWPQVTSRPMFGMQAFYRSAHIFAALPRTRAPETPLSLLIKLPGARAGRLHTASGPGAGWMSFTMEGEGDVSEALRWLGKAYEKAGRPATHRAGRTRRS
jgi:hypothetical protein